VHLLSAPAYLLLGLLTAGPEKLENIRFRAVTLEPNERREFLVPGLVRVTAASGKCVEEAAMLDAASAVILEAQCSGVRTSLAWLDGGTRIHLMACAESDENGLRTPALVALRKKLQGELRSMKTTTACVRNSRVELWGWVQNNAEFEKIRALEKKYGASAMRSFVEQLPDEN
jgi:hypothetical protein